MTSTTAPTSPLARRRRRAVGAAALGLSLLTPAAALSLQQPASAAAGATVTTAAATTGVAAPRGVRPYSAATVRLQQDLAGLGFLYRSGIDGYLGPQTRTAIARFQERYCQRGSGRATARTVRRLEGAVRRVQRAVGTTPDGIYGPLTRRSVARWQARHGLAVDGVAGHRTINALGQWPRCNY